MERTPCLRQVVKFLSQSRRSRSGIEAQAIQAGKLQVVREVESGKYVAQVAREQQLHPAMINRWRREHERYAEQAFSGNGISLKNATRVTVLERLVGQLTLAVPCPGVAPAASPTGGRWRIRQPAD